MSNRSPQQEQFYRWKDDVFEMEYKCPECGNWTDMDNASPVYFSDRPACNNCFQVILSLTKTP